MCTQGLLSKRLPALVALILACYIIIIIHCMHHCECVVPLDIESPEVIILSFNNSFEKLSLPITQVCTIMWEAMFCQDDQLVISNHQTRQKSV